MNFEHAEKIADKLENNLTILQNAAEFVNPTKELEFKSEKYSVSGVFSTLKESLIAYIECDGDNGKLENLIKKLEESAQNRKNHIVGGTLLNAANIQFQFTGEKFIDFNSEADRVLKEIDAQVNVLCKEFAIEVVSNRLSGGSYVQSEYWTNKEVQKALNIAKAVKSLIV